MPLIRCPNCNKMVSDQAAACIHCGRPMNAAVQTDSTRAVESNVRDQVLARLREHNKIQAIKIYRESTGTGLAEAKAAVERIGTEAGIEPQRGFSGCSPIVLLGLLAIFGSLFGDTDSKTSSASEKGVVRIGFISDKSRTVATEASKPTVCSVFYFRAENKN